MPKVITKEYDYKKAVKEALQELLTEDPVLLRKILDAVEDAMLAKLMLEARKDKRRVPRSAVFKILEGKE